MPPEIKTTRKEMTDAAIALVDEAGAASVSARAVANRLGISTQPIYREFGDMDGLKRATAERGAEIFAEYTSGEALDQAVGYVRFASERSNLMDFLFKGKRSEYAGLDELSHGLLPTTDIIDRLTALTGLNKEQTYRLHLYIWMALGGVAAVAANNTVKFSDGEIREFTVTLSRALTEYFKKGE